MVYRVGINGFGRIGRQAFKAINQGNFEDLFEVVAVNDLAPPETLATLLTYDSTYGRYNAEIAAGDKSLTSTARRLPSSPRSNLARSPGNRSRSISSSSRPASSQTPTTPKVMSRREPAGRDLGAGKE